MPRREPQVHDRTAEDLPQIVPEGYILTVLRLPVTGKFSLTWWLDAEGRVGRKGIE